MWHDPHWDMVIVDVPVAVIEASIVALSGTPPPGSTVCPVKIVDAADPGATWQYSLPGALQWALSFAKYWPPLRSRCPESLECHASRYPGSLQQLPGGRRCANPPEPESEPGPEL